jgi:hypothetical protein
MIDGAPGHVLVSPRTFFDQISCTVGVLYMDGLKPQMTLERMIMLIVVLIHLHTYARVRWHEGLRHEGWHI